MALYLDTYFPKKVSALLGTHTHIQTNDAQKLPNDLLFITDVGMTGPENSAIGANFEEVYLKMRFNSKKAFKPSNNKSHINAVVLTFNKDKNPMIRTIKI